MTLCMPGVSVMGGFIIGSTGSLAISIAHIQTFSTGGREDPDKPQDKGAWLVATVAPGGEGDSYVLGRFRKFKECHAALEDLLQVIEHQAVAAEERYLRESS